jgi:hypothetical protein
MSPRSPWHDGAVKPSELARRTHPRTTTAGAQLLVLLVGVLLGIAVGTALRWADDRSWSGAVTTTATVTGLQSNGVHATADGRDVVLHVEKVPATGTRLTIEVRPDGRARPSSYRQTWRGALWRGIALAVGLTVLVQVYRYAVTGRVLKD